jgi:uracil-DNA glycosylase family 4
MSTLFFSSKMGNELEVPIKKSHDPEEIEKSTIIDTNNKKVKEISPIKEIEIDDTSFKKKHEEEQTTYSELDSDIQPEEEPQIETVFDIQTEGQRQTENAFDYEPIGIEMYEQEFARVASIAEEEKTKYWMEKVDSHKKMWTNSAATNNTDSKNNEISMLDQQLVEYFNFPICKDSKCFISGSGSCNAKVVFLAMNPSHYDIKNEEAFTGDAMEFLMKKAKTIVNMDQCYFMYTFPYVIKDNRNSEPMEDRIFLEYTRKRISIIGPKIIVVLGIKPLRYALSGFDYENSESIPTLTDVQKKQRSLKDITKVKIGSKDVTILLCPHPFQVTSIADRDKAKNFGPSKTIMEKWEECFSYMDKIINKNKVKGDLSYNSKGEKFIDVSRVMKTNQVKHEKKKEMRAKKLPVPKGQKKASEIFSKNPEYVPDWNFDVKGKKRKCTNEDVAPLEKKKKSK